MASLGKVVQALCARRTISTATKPLASSCSTRLSFRSVHTTPALLRDTGRDSDDEQPRSWFSRLRKTAQPEQSHSMALSTKETVFEIQFHCVKPECMEDYLGLYSKFQDIMKRKGSGAELAASFTVEIGEQDEAIHIWEYPGGYPTLNEANNIYRTDSEFIDMRKQRNCMLRSRKNQILLPFSFWPHIAPREGTNIYELRSYTLKPGTMYEWANCWAKGIKARQTNNEPVAGYFAQIGNVYSVEHMWAYKDLQTRKETREAAWNRPGWDECVSYTVPLIRHMQSRILIPTPFSPLQ